jgi:hypothetical protein
MKTQDIRNMGLAYVQVLEESKKKLDPVGKADADIDNDGDTDKSDDYLHNRRKSISAAIKGKGTKETVTTEALVGNQHKIDANKNGKVDAHDFKLLRKGKKVAEEVEELDELSKKTLGRYVKAASSDRANVQGDIKSKIASRSDYFGSPEHKADAKVRGNRRRGIDKAVDKLTKEESEWPIFDRIQEKVNQTKGATKPESMEDRFTASDKKMVDGHGGIGKKTPQDFVDDDQIDKNPNQFNAANVKVAPKRHNDQTVGDKTMPKAK